MTKFIPLPMEDGVYPLGAPEEYALLRVRIEGGRVVEVITGRKPLGEAFPARAMRSAPADR